MKHITYSISSILLAVFVGFSLTSHAQELLIVHTNDTHSCIEPLNPHSADTANADKGGFARRATLIKELRAQHRNMLLADCGDFSQGSAYYELYRGEVEIGLMNLMGYDAATIGNHEFDFGLDNMARLYKMAKFPIVCSNYDFTGTVLERYVKPYVVLKKGGLKIGIFGLGPKLEGLVIAKNYEGVRFLDPVKSAQQVVDILKNKKHCDLIVCLSHLGWLEDDFSDNEVFPKLKDVDIVLGGHSHSYFEQPKTLKDNAGKAVTINQMGKNGRFIGTLLLNYSK